ncbi:MAG: HAD family hydrolase [Candidatus Zhuqueibacterota bacterium]
MIEAVLFDFDGVIADTMTYHVQAWNLAFSRYNVAIHWLDVCQLEGKMAEEIGVSLAEQKGLSLKKPELLELARNKREFYRKVTRATIYPGVEDMLAFLKRRTKKVALVTGSTLPNIIPVVGENFLENFDTIVTGDAVSRTKPDPEPFLKASRELHVTPAQCLVIENAPLGIRAARSAGMYCVAVQTTIEDTALLREADLIVNDLQSVPIERLLNGRH